MYHRYDWMNGFADRGRSEILLCIRFMSTKSADRLLHEVKQVEKVALGSRTCCEAKIRCKTARKTDKDALEER